MDEENMPVMYKQHQLRLRRNYAKKLIKADACDVLVIRWIVVRKFCFPSNSRQRFVDMSEQKLILSPNWNFNKEVCVQIIKASEADKYCDEEPSMMDNNFRRSFE